MEGGRSTDCPVGSIVWVRRRNGSWWPGKLVGPEELPASQLTSPRTGTPVKLLGREDASVESCWQSIEIRKPYHLDQSFQSYILYPVNLILNVGNDSKIIRWDLENKEYTGLVDVFRRDWYNLEKSKRVKAFRCGEFDDCIEKAEAAQGMPPKKREKYARREDAILHALELEKEMLLKEGTLGICHKQARGRSSGFIEKDSGESDNNNNNNGDLRNPKVDDLWTTQHSLEKSETVPDLLTSEKNHGGNEGETTPRMRGLEELGLKTTTEQRKAQSLYVSDCSLKFANDSEVPYSMEPSMERESHIIGETSLERRERSHEGQNEESLFKKRDRSLVQVLQNSTKVERHHILHPDLHPVSNSISGELMGGMYHSKRSTYAYLPAEFSDVSDDKEMHHNRLKMSPSQLGECDSYPFSAHLVEDGACEFMDNLDPGASGSTSSDTQSESDSSETEPDLDEEMTSVSGGGVPIEVELDAFGGDDAFEEGGSMSTGESNESSLSGDLPHFYPHDPLSGNEAVSKWQLKGKRNIRSLAKRTMDSNLRSMSRYIHGRYQEEKESRRMASLDNVGYPQIFKSLPRGRNSFRFNVMEFKGMSWETRAAMARCLETTRHFNPMFVGHYPFGGRMRPLLIDVNLRVQASYQKSPVPIVSLMSKLDGKAIIGHPIQIEPLEYGTSERLVPASGYFGNGLISQDGSPALPPTWRTARRTNFRVPRLHPPSALSIDETAEDHSVDRDRALQLKRINTGSSDMKTGALRKNLPQSPRSSGLQRKYPKKVSSSTSSLKTKALSSIGLEHNTSSNPYLGSSNTELGMIIKPESAGPPTVACIPVKLVFSRLLEKINRPPSKSMQIRES